MTYKTICKCDHDMETHYKETFASANGIEGRRTTCLARGCECRRYRDMLAKEEPKSKPKPHLLESFGTVPVKTNPPSAPSSAPPQRITWPNWP